MAGIFDEDGSALSYLTFDLVAGEETDPLTLRIVPEAASRLRVKGDTRAQILAREAGSEEFIDLAMGIDLSGHAVGEPVDYEFIARASEAIEGIERLVFYPAVVWGRAAGW